jgi:hypothetical protein
VALDDDVIGLVAVAGAAEHAMHTYLSVSIQFQLCIDRAYSNSSTSSLKFSQPFLSHG